MPYTDDQLMKLAKEKVDTFDMKTLLSFAVEQVFILYKDNPILAQEDVEILEIDLTE